MVIPVLLTALVAVLLVSDVSAYRSRRNRPVSQPIAFNHLKHTEELGLTCGMCHKYVETGRHAGLPEAETCAMCHSTKLGTSPEAAKVTEMLNNGDSIHFNKLFRLHDYVFYSHRRHVGIAGLECTNCHDGIANTVVPPKQPLVKVDMAFCVDCHEARKVTTDCTACHR